MAMRLIDLYVIEFSPIRTNSITNLFQMVDATFYYLTFYEALSGSHHIDKFINNSLENKWVFLLPNHYCEPVSQLKCRL